MRCRRIDQQQQRSSRRGRCARGVHGGQTAMKTQTLTEGLLKQSLAVAYTFGNALTMRIKTRQACARLIARGGADVPSWLSSQPTAPLRPAAVLLKRSPAELFHQNQSQRFFLGEASGSAASPL